MAWLLTCRSARADPYLEWYTLETPHFRVHYHGGLEGIAQRTGSLAEAIRSRIAPEMLHAPDDVTHIRLADLSDSANGDAQAVPYNAIRLLVTAPGELSTLGDYDDWQAALVTHEQTHVVHLDTISGPFAVLNGVVGKAYSANQIQPHWVLEGIAVAMESRLTSGGRLRSSLFDMYLRADVLEDHLAGLDEMSHGVRRWPGGDIWYLYGGKFIGWILDTYGDDTFGAVSTVYGSGFGWDMNRAIHRATGRTYPELYDGWTSSLREKYGAQMAAVAARGLREGTRLTTGAHGASSPRFVPRCGRSDAREALLYFRDDGDRPSGYYRLPLATRDRAAEDELSLVARANGDIGTASFDPTCGLVFDGVAPSVRRYFFEDLHYQPPGTSSRTGLLGTRQRWTTGLRARSPDVSPDGRRVVFVTNHAGTTTLRIGDVDAASGVRNVRRLVPSAEGEQAYSPRFSPDGRHVVYSAWTRGGFRDIRVVDADSGRFFELSHDRALDVTPSFSPDGRYVLFSSDRTGIYDVYAYELGTGQLFQVTNVRTGAFFPELSPDGRTLVYVGYGTDGFDLYSMPFSETRFLPALPPNESRPRAVPEPPHVRWPVRRYSAWSTLAPRSFSLDYGTGTFGRTLTADLHGDDIVGLHSVAANFSYYTGIDAVAGSVGYAYHALPVSLSISGFRDVVPRAPLGDGDSVVPLRDYQLGLTTGMSYGLPGEFDGQTVGISYTASSHTPSYSLDRLADPWLQTHARPSHSFTSSVRVAWQYSNAYRPALGVSNERGFTLSLASDFAGTATGSNSSLAAFDGRAIAYVPAPWLRHHAFALALSGGAASGSFAQSGYYYTGGFADTNTWDAIVSGIRQSAFVLRGYHPGVFIGRQYNLANLEYRFPIAWIEHGVSTLPFFVHGVSGTLFADYGGAYDRLDPNDLLSKYHLGLGGEVRVGLTLGYFLDTGFRLGWAKGFGDRTITPGSQFYFVVAATF